MLLVCALRLYEVPKATGIFFPKRCAALVFPFILMEFVAAGALPFPAVSSVTFAALSVVQFTNPSSKLGLATRLLVGGGGGGGGGGMSHDVPFHVPPFETHSASAHGPLVCSPGTLGHASTGGGGGGGGGGGSTGGVFGKISTLSMKTVPEPGIMYT